MSIKNLLQRETGARDTRTDGGEAAGTNAEIQRDAYRSETRVEGSEIGREVCTGSIDLSAHQFSRILI